MATWTQEDSKLAIAEGWEIFDNSDYGLEIERIDDPEEGEPTFPGDDEAIAHVRKQAAAGSALHIKALAIHKAGREKLKATA